jgi:uncharacterized protein YecE (DUF72 family)
MAGKNMKFGCCGFRLAMAEYAKHFDVVEVQQTFYQPPQLTTLEKWRQQAPEGFEFTVKAWQLITHESRSPTYKRLKRKLTEQELEEVGAFRPTAIVKEAWDTTVACADALGARRILLQCPARFTPTKTHIDNLTRFIKSARKRRRDFILLWEPRGEWPDALVRDICKDLDLIHVVDPMAARTVTPDRYYRLHGRRGRDYEDEELEELYQMLPTDRLSYVMFNNVRMVRDALRFKEIAQRLASEYD